MLSTGFVGRQSSTVFLLLGDLPFSSVDCEIAENVGDACDGAGVSHMQPSTLHDMHAVTRSFRHHPHRQNSQPFVAGWESAVHGATISGMAILPLERLRVFSLDGV